MYLDSWFWIFVVVSCIGVVWNDWERLDCGPESHSLLAIEGGIEDDEDGCGCFRTEVDARRESVRAYNVVMISHTWGVVDLPPTQTKE